MAYELDGDQIKLDGQVVATVGSDREAAALLAARANLADRDEALLDRLGETIAARNE